MEKQTYCRIKIFYYLHSHEGTLPFHTPLLVQRIVGFPTIIKAKSQTKLTTSP